MSCGYCRKILMVVQPQWLSKCTVYREQLDWSHTFQHICSRLALLLSNQISNVPSLIQWPQTFCTQDPFVFLKSTDEPQRACVIKIISINIHHTKNLKASMYQITKKLHFLISFFGKKSSVTHICGWKRKSSLTAFSHNHGYSLILYPNLTIGSFLKISSV